MKSSQLDPRSDSESEPLSPEQEAAAKAAGTWVHQLARTLKTCRLYDSNNPTVVKFRQELAVSLQQLLQEQGSVMLTFSAEDVFCEGVSLYPARSRDDNVAFAFYRDGIRSITFSPEFEASELDGLIACILHVTGQNLEDSDLVTLLWEAHLQHLEVDYVPGEADVGSSAGEGEQGVLWPTAASDFGPSATEAAEAAAEAPVVDVSAENANNPSRSDDWSVGEFTMEIEAGFEELQALAPSEVERFRNEYETEHRESVVSAAIAVVRAYLSAGIGPEDRAEIARFLPRVLRQAFVQGSWREATEVLGLLEANPTPEWSRETFAQELLQPISVSSIRERLEQEEPEAVTEFVSFAQRLEETAADLLNLVLAEMQQPRDQRLLTDAIAELCRHNPERLAPWLSDPRPFVVKNVVHILGMIGGESIVGLLRPVAEHPEARIRLEVLSALKQVEPRSARPLLTAMLGGADTRMFCAVLHLLSQERDASTAELLLNFMLDPEFEKRPVEEKRAIYSALSSVGGDEVIPELEAELHKGNWFSRSQEVHRQAVARCLARIGTPLAREILEHGAQSRRAPVRKACEDALVKFGTHD